MNLQEKLESFHIPKMRRDVSKLNNILWLNRNLAINNSSNPLLKEVKEELTLLTCQALVDKIFE